MKPVNFMVTVFHETSIPVENTYDSKKALKKCSFSKEKNLDNFVRALNFP